MRALLITAFSFASAATCLCEPAAHREWRSPDGHWIVACDCRGTWQLDSCRITLSRLVDGKVFFTHYTNDRYIAALWDSNSSRCVLLDVPDNANSYLWLFRVQGGYIAREKLDYDKISEQIEAAQPAARRQEPAITTSGIEKMDWLSNAQIRFRIT